jgi:hypothetical protein
VECNRKPELRSGESKNQSYGMTIHASISRPMNVGAVYSDYRFKHQPVLAGASGKDC